jgi:peroxiredoxin
VLLRVDQLERQLIAAGRNVDEVDNGPEFGHAPGTTAPSFAVSDPEGRKVSTGDLLAPGLPLLLIFTSAGCGPCKALLPKIAAWQRTHAERLTIALLNGGDQNASIAEAAEQKLDHMLVDNDLAVFEAYQANGTPSAVLVADDGTIASYVAAGAERVERLLESAVTEQRESEDQGLSVGSPAPELELPILDGEPLNLGSLREQTAVLFWNPACGFCNSMRDDLLAWERHVPVGAPRLLIVSAGDEASVRAEGFLSSVALDKDFSAGAAFGAGGTPMAILIDNEGRIASSLAGGAEAVFALAGGRSRADTDAGSRSARSSKR